MAAISEAEVLTLNVRRANLPTFGAAQAANAAPSAASVRVLVLAPGAGLGGLGFWGSLEQEVVVGRDERVGRHHRVGVVDGPVLAREGDPARAFPQPVLQLGADLA